MTASDTPAIQVLSPAAAAKIGLSAHTPQASRARRRARMPKPLARSRAAMPLYRATLDRGAGRAQDRHQAAGDAGLARMVGRHGEVSVERLTTVRPRTARRRRAPREHARDVRQRWEPVRCSSGSIAIRRHVVQQGRRDAAMPSALPARADGSASELPSQRLYVAGDDCRHGSGKWRRLGGKGRSVHRSYLRVLEAIEAGSHLSAAVTALLGRLHLRLRASAGRGRRACGAAGRAAGRSPASCRA